MGDGENKMTNKNDMTHNGKSPSSPPKSQTPSQGNGGAAPSSPPSKSSQDKK